MFAQSDKPQLLFYWENKMTTELEQEIVKFYLVPNSAREIYKNAIPTWTVRDYAKITTAKANNLNYKLYYKEEDLYEQYAGFKRVK